MSSQPSTSAEKTSNSILLFNSTSMKFNYLSGHDLNDLRKNKLVWPVKVGVGAMTISMGDEGEGTLLVVNLPTKVIMGRLLGWWTECWVVDGVEDV